LAPLTRAGPGAWNSASWGTAPVKYSAGALRDGCEPLRVISIVPFPPVVRVAGVPAVAGLAASIRGEATGGDEHASTRDHHVSWTIASICVETPTSHSMCRSP